MDITISIPEEIKQDAINAICVLCNYREELEDWDDKKGPSMVANPETKETFFKRMIGEMIKEKIKTAQHRIDEAIFNEGLKKKQKRIDDSSITVE